MKKLLSYDYKFYIEPTNPITTPEEFTNELIKYFSKKYVYNNNIKKVWSLLLKLIMKHTYVN